MPGGHIAHQSNTNYKSDEISFMASNIRYLDNEQEYISFKNIFKFFTIYSYVKHKAPFGVPVFEKILKELSLFIPL